MPLIKRREWVVLLTQRPMTMPRHPGQISFPGGRRESFETAMEAALRETEEEVGIAPQDIHVLGRLPSFNAVSEYRVTPYVGKEHRLYDMPYEGPDGIHRNIWGMTAMMMRRLYERGFADDNA